MGEAKDRMLMGYARISKVDHSETLDLQRYALIGAGVSEDRIYQDYASGKQEARPGLDACLEALRQGDVLIVWKLDRLGRNLRHLVSTVQYLIEREIGFRVLVGKGVNIDTTTASGNQVLGFFAALAEFQRELISEQTRLGLASARARGRKGGAPFKMNPAKLRQAMTAMNQPETKIDALCVELGISRQTLYRHVDPQGNLRADGKKLLQSARD